MKSELQEFQTEVETRIRTIEITTDELTNEGIDILMTKLFQLDEGVTTNWKIIGYFIEDNKIELSYSDARDEWSASAPDGLDFISGTTASMAICRLMVIKELIENPDNKYTLRMPFKSAKELLEGGSEINIDMIVAEGASVKPSDVVELILKPGYL